jgi:hypothetical protein
VLQAVETPSAVRPAGNLVGLALALGARAVPGWSADEEPLTHVANEPLRLLVSLARDAIGRGEDPLGDDFCRLFSADERRPRGATYTPAPIVEAMLTWAARQAHPVRVVDPGAGSARFLVAAGRRFPDAELIAVEVDPLAAILARGHLAAAGLAERSRVVVRDYRSLSLPLAAGPTLFLGNPPYVRHHLIDPAWKAWLVATARRYGIQASQLAGLHAHFFLAIAEQSRPGDIGALITAAEWLDVNYGRLVRELLLGVLGVHAIQVIEPGAEPFPGTQATAVITGFRVGGRPATVSLRRVATLDALGKQDAKHDVRRERLEAAPRWTPLTRATPERREGFVELGELCRVHRGAVTGANRVWIAGDHATGLPDRVLFASVTKARELFAARDGLTDPSNLRQVIDLPIDLDEFDPADRRHVDAFLRYARAAGAEAGFVARNRKRWWAVGLREPAPILATYMARRPPAFVRNVAGVRHLNIAHGLYPRDPLDETVLRNLANFLSGAVSTDDGRTYAGGLTKFEPREMERLLVPRPEVLADTAAIESLT